MAHQVRLLRDFGRDLETGDVTQWSLNSRLDNLQAAFLDIQLKDYNEIIRRRREIAALYHEQLGDLQAFKMPPAPNADPRHFDVYQNFECKAQNRDALREFLRENGIGTLIQWGGKAVHQFKDLGFTCSLPVTEKLFSEFIMLPLNMMISDEEVTYVSQQIRRFYNQS